MTILAIHRIYARFPLIYMTGMPIEGPAASSYERGCLLIAYAQAPSCLSLWRHKEQVLQAASMSIIAESDTVSSLTVSQKMESFGQARSTNWVAEHETAL